MIAEADSPKCGSVLVVGAGIGGMQASLDLADAGLKVYLIEKGAAIGGVMSQLDKTFPTNDCAMCTMAPRLVSVGRHKDIEIITLADVEDVRGEPGNFTVKLRKRARYIDQRKCTGCGECAEHCPVEIPSEYNAGLETRKAIYRSYPQAYPNAFAIDKRFFPPCRNACPAGVNVQGFVALLSRGRFDEALELYRSHNPFPATCGRICLNPCQEACNRGLLDEPLKIRDLHRFLADREIAAARAGTPPQVSEEMAAERRSLFHQRGDGRRVAIVGSGPAGLTCAWDLANMGFKPVVFESLAVAGGMLRVGVPRYRLPIDVLDYEVEAIRHAGVDIRLDTPVGPNLTLNDLFEQGFEAIFIAIGTHKSRRLDIEGEDLGGVIHGTDFLHGVKMAGPADIADKRVVVVGGGNAAIDSARTALRMGARRVTILYRRSRDQMPAREEEVEACEEEGVEIHFLAAPTRIIGEAGEVAKLECVRMALGEPDASGRRRPVPIGDSTFTLECDIVIPAVSQEPDMQFLSDLKTIRITETGLVPLAGTGLAGVHGFTDLLRDISLGEKVDLGERVVVIGGGNAAMDVARTVRRLGVGDVQVACIEAADEMPAAPNEVRAAEEEGIVIGTRLSPKRVLGREGRVSGVLFAECVSAFDKDGRFSPVVRPRLDRTIEADSVVVAIGQTVDWGLFRAADGVLHTNRGFIDVDNDTLATNVEGIFAGGDVVSGPDAAVTAIVAGHRGATSIDRFLNGEDLRMGREDLSPPHPREALAPVPPGRHGRMSDVPMPALSPEERIRSFEEVELGYSEEDALKEAGRCLNCSVCTECMMCVRNCEANAIDHGMCPENEMELNVGAVVLSPGYDLLSADTKLEYGCWEYPNAVTALEFERILSSTGPYQGRVLRPSDGRPPKKIAFIQCVSSREKERDYCSSICCMYATKEAVIAREHSEEELECSVYYMDIRAFGKGFEEYYQRARELGVRYIRCRPSAVEQIEDGSLRIHHLGEDGKMVSEDYDMVVLAMGMGIPEELKVMSRKLGITVNEHGFCNTRPFNPVESSRKGIFVCGPFTEPKDIPETVTQASGAASKALSLLSDVRGTLITPKEFPPERDVSGQSPRVGVFVCHCGTNIAGVIDVEHVVEYAGTLPNVLCAEHHLYTCSNDTQDKIKERIVEHNLNRVVVASCTPRTHEPLFRNTIREAGLNPYLFEMANIRDQCSWVHMHSAEEATHKAEDLVRIAVAKARLLEPLYSMPIPINSGVLVIGGGIAGMTAALSLADQGFDVNVVERDSELGGNARHIHSLLGGEQDPGQELGKLVRRTSSHPEITVWTEADVTGIAGFVGNFTTQIRQGGKDVEVCHGAVVVATGAKAHLPEEYLYGSDDRVITQLRLEERLAQGDFNAQRVVMIQCVGSREGERMYCSRICCSQAIKNALRIKETSPDTEVFILYREMRTYGFREKYYSEARAKGVRFVRYDAEHKPAVSANDDGLRIETRDPVLGRALRIDSDLLVLAPAIVPQDDVETVAQMLKVPLTRDRFFLEAHMKLRPVDFAVEGVFLAGMAHAPKSVDETIAQAEAAAGRAATIISKPEYTPEAIVSSVDTDLCAACGLCVSICGYDAPDIVTVRGKTFSRINEALCKGCGACAMACPSGAVQQLGFRPKQICEMVDAALG